MDDEDFNSLMRGMREVAAYEAGAREGFVTHVPPSVDVRAISKGCDRRRLALPKRAARIPLAMIGHDPQTVERVRGSP